MRLSVLNWGKWPMGIMTSNLFFIAGTVCGIRIAPNCKVTSINKIFYEALFTAKQVEEKYRKPERPRSDDV
ncbi:hypothetical protein CDL12_04890 [Handroanthus impetiginosus]|uniref:Uncharacterized protein n=1 Tax=Handroanthus impetiginosus TaxID=429701 RepID=A0A2G9HY12_9LAMI|nr:hypothetical protein CDL12_04890 [Handroanthus impetiginosus]